MTDPLHEEGDGEAVAIEQDEKALSFRQRVADILQVPLDEFHVDADVDLLSVDGLTVGGRVIDSLTLVSLITVIEDEFEVSLQDLIDHDEPLTFRTIVGAIAAEDVPG